MRVVVLGLWHLGSVTAACLADENHDVFGVDEDPEVIRGLQSGKAPLFEPDLDALINKGIERGNLSFGHIDESAIESSDILWVTYDTPVDDSDEADSAYVIDRVKAVIPLLGDQTLILISSQLPVGSVAELETFARDKYRSKGLRFACSPENLRLGQALEVFKYPDRVIVGARSEVDREDISQAYGSIRDKIVWMSVESAEMTKHAINAFLATSIAFTNELASVCELVGASAEEVELGLKTEQRIGQRAYVRAGGPFAGGTLARDIGFLNKIAVRKSLPLAVISSVGKSNDEHKKWPARVLQNHLGDLRQRNIAVWGLTYKPGTNTLRRSTSVELCDWLLSRGASVSVYDPVVSELPKRWKGRVKNCPAGKNSLEHADALIVGTAWPELREIASSQISDNLSKLLIVDANGFLKTSLATRAHLYCMVGEVIRGAEA